MQIIINRNKYFPHHCFLHVRLVCRVHLAMYFVPLSWTLIRQFCMFLYFSMVHSVPILSSISMAHTIIHNIQNHPLVLQYFNAKSVLFCLFLHRNIPAFRSWCWLAWLVTVGSNSPLQEFTIKHFQPPGLPYAIDDLMGHPECVN